MSLGTNDAGRTFFVHALNEPGFGGLGASWHGCKNSIYSQFKKTILYTYRQHCKYCQSAME